MGKTCTLLESLVAFISVRVGYSVPGLQILPLVQLFLSALTYNEWQSFILEDSETQWRELTFSLFCMSSDTESNLFEST